MRTVESNLFLTYSQLLFKTCIKLYNDFVLFTNYTLLIFLHTVYCNFFFDSSFVQEYMDKK